MASALAQPIHIAASEGEDSLIAALRPLQERLAVHPLYQSIRSLAALRLFMESHVFAVWDFMSLLKGLQNRLTCIRVPWIPTGDATTRRLINEIVLGEESDTYEGEPLSHFELYLRAMHSCGAATAPVEKLISRLVSGADLVNALQEAPKEAATFVRSTFAVLDTGEPHRIAAAFTFGREDLIPDMFSAFVRELDKQLPGQIAPFLYYLERHIELDGDEHGPMALAMMRQLCTTGQQWQEAGNAAYEALEARLALWDGIHARILANAPSSENLNTKP
jgi:hypothetical protein